VCSTGMTPPGRMGWWVEAMCLSTSPPTTLFTLSQPHAGVYRPDRFLHGSRNLPVWTLTSREAWELPVYLVKSDFYVGYWVLASDVWSSNIYAYALAPDVWVPSELSEWQPAAFNSDMNLVRAM
jgi:hypothetical protein